MNNAILPLIVGFLAGNEKARNQVMIGLQQIAGQGIDMLNGMGKTGGDASNVPDRQPVPESDE